MTAGLAALVVAAGLVGALVVGPALSGAILAWVGQSVVVPALLGRPAEPGEIRAEPARCRGCGATVEVRLAGRIPLVPWLATAGRCRACRHPRPTWMAEVEVATGGLFALAAAALGWSPELPAVLVLLAGLVAVSAVDLVYMRIPTSFVWVAAAASAAAIGGATLASGEVEAASLAGAAIGAALYAGFLGAFYLVSSNQMGYGDVRLAALIGGVVGWVTWVPERPVEGPVAGVLGAAFLAGLVGTIIGVALLVRRGRSSHFPFGPAMAVGAVAVVLLG